MDGIRIRLYSNGGTYIELHSDPGAEKFDGVFSLLKKVFSESPCLTWVIRERDGKKETVVFEPNGGSFSAGYKPDA